MRSVLGESGSQDRLLRKLFLDRLPAGVRRIIISHPVEDLDQLAKIADRVMEENRKCTSGFGDGPEYNDYASSIGTFNVSLSTLHDTVTDLAQTVTSLTHSLQSMPRTPHNFPNTRDNNATTTSFSQRSPVVRDTSLFHFCETPIAFSFPVEFWTFAFLEPTKAASLGRSPAATVNTRT